MKYQWHPLHMAEISWWLELFSFPFLRACNSAMAVTAETGKLLSYDREAKTNGQIWDSACSAVLMFLSDKGSLWKPKLMICFIGWKQAFGGLALGHFHHQVGCPFRRSPLPGLIFTKMHSFSFAPIMIVGTYHVNCNHHESSFSPIMLVGNCHLKS